MILKEYQLHDIIKKNAYPRFVLFFGPNEGLIRDDILKICTSFKNNIETEEITINGKALDENQVGLNNKSERVIEALRLLNNYKRTKI